jgi:hypothetical protein
VHTGTAACPTFKQQHYNKTVCERSKPQQQHGKKCDLHVTNVKHQLPAHTVDGSGYHLLAFYTPETLQEQY